jgi:hypothetical protein
LIVSVGIAHPDDLPWSTVVPELWAPDSQILRVRAAFAGTEYRITWRTCRNVTANLFDDP